MVPLRLASRVALATSMRGLQAQIGSEGGVWELTETHFKGWAKPGPIPPGALSPPAVPPDETLDAISGHFRIFQLRDGHRFSTDDVLTAWYGTSWAPTASRVLDLGSGIGSVGMIAAWRLPGARFVTIEAQDDSVRLARKSAAYNGLESRYEIRHADFRDADALDCERDVRPRARQPAVLSSRHRNRRRPSAEGRVPLRAARRHRRLRAHCRAHLAPGGVFACVFPEEQRERLEAAARAARGTSSGDVRSSSAKVNRRSSDCS